jgi:hypothetical protein
MTTATAFAINIPLMVIAFALVTGIPLWLVFKHPDRSPGLTRTVPQYRRARATHVAHVPGQTWHVDPLRLTSH